MHWDGVVELVRRAFTLLLLVMAAVDTFASLDAPSWINGLRWAAPAVAVYVLIPRPSIPANALRHETLPAILFPDLLGFLLGLTFFALPIVIINSEPWLEGVWQIPVFLGVPGLFALLILYIAAGYACSWVLLREDGLKVAGSWRVMDLPFSQIVKVTPVERRLPGWVAPALVLFGGWRGAGVALLHAGRAAHYLQFDLRAGQAVRISVDAFPEIDRVVSALNRAGVPLEAELGTYARKIVRRRNSRGAAKPS